MNLFRRPRAPAKRVLTFSDAQEKAAWLDGEASIDALDEDVRRTARRFAIAYGKNDELDMARAIHSFVLNSIPYVHDPSVEEFADAATTMGFGDREAGGDCDDKARLFVALCRSVELESRILPVMDPSDWTNFVHVQAQVTFPGACDYARQQGFPCEAGWLRVELIIKGVRLGEDEEKVPRDARGRRVYTDGKP